MFIYLLRHGDAIQDPSLHDSDRPLSELGKRQAITVAQFMKNSGVSLNTVFCSPLLRAQQTAQPLSVGLPNKVITTEYLVPGNDIRQIIELLNEHASESLLLVGHEPSLSELTSMLSTGSTDSHIEFRKATLALVHTNTPVRKGHGLLKWLVPIEHMEHYAT